MPRKNGRPGVVPSAYPDFLVEATISTACLSAWSRYRAERRVRPRRFDVAVENFAPGSRQRSWTKKFTAAVCAWTSAARRRWSLTPTHFNDTLTARRMSTDEQYTNPPTGPRRAVAHAQTRAHRGVLGGDSPIREIAARPLAVW